MSPRWAIVAGAVLAIGGGNAHIPFPHRPGVGPCPQPAASMASRPRGVDPESDGIYRRGKALFQEGRFADALPLLQQAGADGHPSAQHLLGLIYHHGQPGVPEDSRRAVRWFSLGAAQGDRASEYALGRMYEKGEGGLARDAEKAGRLYEASARQGFEKAQFALGLLCEFELRDRGGAIYWLDQAGTRGESMARWAAEWLRRPDTPHFRSESQFAAYVNAEVAGWMRSTAREAAAPDDFIQRYYQARTRVLYERQGREAGDRCRLDGTCY